MPEGITARHIDTRPDNHPAPHARRSYPDSPRLSFQNTTPPPPRTGVVIMRAVVTRLALLAVLVSASFALLHTDARAAPDRTDDCPADTARALQQARTSLESDNPAEDRAALTCLVEVVAALDSRLSQLMTGEIPFEGQAWLEKGWVISKPAPGAE